MTIEVKQAFGTYIAEFYSSLVPTTKPMHEFVVRGLAKSCVWAPGRMIDQVEEMVSSWQRNDTDQAPTQPPKLPVVIVAMAKDYIPTGRDFGRQISERMDVILPGDEKERCFGLRVMGGDIRAQVAFCAVDEATAKSLASQFSLFVDAVDNRRFFAQYSFAGEALPFPVQIETPEVPAIEVKTGNKNLSVLAADLTLKASIPLFSAPKLNEPNDGQGTVGSTTDPAGYPLVIEVVGVNTEPRP